MIVQFPIAHADELLGSVIARHVQRQNHRDDKVALELLFGSRLVVPSALFQGHIEMFLASVGHVWRQDARQLIEAHTLVPLFRPFVPGARYAQLLSDLRKEHTNSSLLRSGIVASVLFWPSRYRVCPLCWKGQQEKYGYSYWQRLFQCPGVECCPLHRCLLNDTGVEMQSVHRHRFVGAHEAGAQKFAVRGYADDKQIKLATLVRELFRPDQEMPDQNQWSSYYQQLASEAGLLRRNRPDHSALAEVVTLYWGKEWLKRQGLELGVQDNWLVRMFRKHRRPFTYLQHILCLMALVPDIESVRDMLGDAAHCPQYPGEKQQYNSSRHGQRCQEYRNAWRRLLKKLPSLKEIRSDKEGLRLYSWLYRYDNEWLQTHKPQRLECIRRAKVNWRDRDLKIVRQLLRVEKDCFQALRGPRRSRAWYCRQVEGRCVLEKKLSLLPLCKEFFARYAETVEEYQARRLASVMVELTRNHQQGTPLHEIERLAGLSKERCREAARKILLQSIPAWQASQAFSCRRTA